MCVYVCAFLCYPYIEIDMLSTKQKFNKFVAGMGKTMLVVLIMMMMVVTNTNELGWVSKCHAETFCITVAISS